MRPYVFFNSMGELMNLYWSGAAEEKKSALQGNLMLQSAEFEHFLSNGIAVKIVSRGAISFDLSGQVRANMGTIIYRNTCISGRSAIRAAEIDRKFSYLRLLIPIFKSRPIIRAA